MTEIKTFLKTCWGEILEEEKVTWSQLGHTYHRYANPISEKKFDQLCDIFKRKPSVSVLDIGSGNGYLLNKIVEAAFQHGTAIEPHTTKEEFVKSDKITLIEYEAMNFVEEKTSSQYNLSMSIGSSHALGGYAKTLDVLSKMTVKGGLILIADGFWQKEPDPEYLSFLGAETTELNSHTGNLFEGEKFGLRPLWSSTASLEEWDHYEWNFSLGIEDYFYENPDHDQKTELLERIEKWRHGYWKWGRETLGFGLYLFRKQP